MAEPVSRKELKETLWLHVALSSAVLMLVLGVGTLAHANELREWGERLTECNLERMRESQDSAELVVNLAMRLAGAEVTNQSSAGLAGSLTKMVLRGARLPKGAMKKQARAPCKESENEVTINGACWVEVNTHGKPCAHYEYNGACYMPVSSQDGTPSSESREPGERKGDGP